MYLHVVFSPEVRDPLDVVIVERVSVSFWH